MNLPSFAVLDTETTGLTKDPDTRVIEIGIVRFEGGVCVRRYQSLVRPDILTDAGAEIAQWYGVDVAGTHQARCCAASGGTPLRGGDRRGDRCGAEQEGCQRASASSVRNEHPGKVGGRVSCVQQERGSLRGLRKNPVDTLENRRYRLRHSRHNGRATVRETRSRRLRGPGCTRVPFVWATVADRMLS